jgi:LPXTG-motif cell wall-anchored protein
MNRILKRTAVLAGAGALSLSLATAAPAFAVEYASLPEGQQMHALMCNPEVGGNQLFSVDVATGELSAVGEPTDQVDANCYGPMVVDPVSGTVFSVAYTSTSNQLIAVDLETGEMESGPEVTENGQGIFIDSFAIGADGHAYAVNAGGLYSLNINTGAATWIGPTNIGATTSFAYDPSSEQFVLFAHGGGLVYSVDVTNAALTPFADLNDAIPTTWVYGLTFDADGNAWFLNDTDFGDGGWQRQPWKVDLTDVADSARAAEPFYAESEGESYNFWSRSLLITDLPIVPVDETPGDETDGDGTPADGDTDSDEGAATPAADKTGTLAETGVDAATPIFLLGALGAALVGGVLVVGSRFRRRGSEI